MKLEELDRIPPKYLMWKRPEAEDFAFGIETNLAGTPAMDRLWEYISKGKEENKIRGSDISAGNLSKSLHLDDTDDWFFDNVLMSAIAEYKNEYPVRCCEQNLTMIGADHNIFSGNEKVPFVLSSIWVNFQRQHEFNPMHNHTGLFSFVIMMKIPYDWTEQYELPHVRVSHSPSAGNLEFLYIDIMGNIKSLPYKLDSNCEGLMLFFPASTRHLVYPFYECEEERITISGNIAYGI
tara:strand:- start:628 stop:1335 length:708 start_codon:yes stop_codon:yes gene_type:complete